MYEEDEVEIPIYLITGFLESGKTSFINFTVAQEYFQIDGPTLLITTEEGEVEYDEKELLKHNTVLEIVEGPEQFTLDYLKKLNRKYRPERIILEYNPLWSVKKLEEMERLQAENEYLRAENAVLKKLRELRLREEKEQEEKRKLSEDW